MAHPGVRVKVARRYVTNSLFHFEWLTPRERRALIGDILALYEACLLDLGRSGDDDYFEIAYPKDR